MQFTPFDYMAWAKAHQGRYPHDLSVSGMAPPPPELFRPDPHCLTLEGVSPALRADLKQAIAGEYGVQASRVLLASGTSEANFLVYGALLNRGDAVLVETPAYQSLTRLPGVFGIEALPFPRRAENHFALDLAAIKRAWRPKVKLIAFASPHNPSGSTADSATLSELGAWLEEVDAYALVDEVYRDFNPAPGPVGQAIHPRLITTSSLTKVYGLGSLRAGWALMPPALVEKAEQLYDFMAVNPSATMLKMALSAFPVLPRLRERAIGRAAANRVKVERWLGRSGFFTGELPPHGFVALLSLPPGTDDMALVKFLADEYQVLLVPGSFFGAPGTMRIAYGMETDRLDEALSRLEAGAETFAKQSA